VLIVATVREDEAASDHVLGPIGDELTREPHCGSLTLLPLSRADTTALVQTLARTEGDEGAEAARAERIWAISEGNPFMAVEAVRALQEGVMPDGSAALALPARIREVIVRRVERLSAQSQELAAVAAVIGREFEFGLLHSAAGVGEREAALGVEELVRRRILHGVGERFDFTHDRIRKAIATGLLGPRRKVLHGQVAAAIEELYADRLEPHATALGQHYLQAEAWDKASTYLLQAGRAAARRSADREAIACLDPALGALVHLPASPDTTERAVDVRVLLSYPLFRLAARDFGLGHLLAAQRLAAELDDQPRLGRVLAALTEHRWFFGEYDSAVDTGQRAVAIGSAIGDTLITTAALSSLGRAYHSLGDFARAKRLYQDKLRELSRDPKQSLEVGIPPYPLVAYRLAWILAELGELTEGLALAEQAAEICQGAARWYGLALSLLPLGLVHLRRGDFQAAILVLEKGLNVCESREFRLLIPAARAFLGYAYALAGRTGEGLPLLEQSGRDADRLPIVWSQALWSAWLAEALLLAGRVEDAAAAGQRALDLAVRRKERGQEAYAQRLLGEIASHGDHLDIGQAERHYGLAMSLAGELGMRPLVAHCRFGLGKLYQRVGRRDEAREHLTTAVAMYREMGMRFWPEQAEALVSSGG
jgi:tetratricopeptide (TPR) repeat protein